MIEDVKYVLKSLGFSIHICIIPSRMSCTGFYLRVTNSNGAIMVKYSVKREKWESTSIWSRSLLNELLCYLNIDEVRCSLRKKYA